jgi:hypothetical protein
MAAGSGPAPESRHPCAQGPRGSILLTVWLRAGSRGRRRGRHRLHHASPLLLIEVAAVGIPLYEATAETWPLFQLYARRRFEDTEKYRQRRWEAHVQ